MKIEAISDVGCIGVRVLVKLEKIQEMTSGGIVLPEIVVDREQDNITDGILVDYGKFAFTDICDESEKPKKGAHVYFVKYAGKAMSVDGEEYRIINDEDIFAIHREDMNNAG